MESYGIGNSPSNSWNSGVLFCAPYRLPKTGVYYFAERNAQFHFFTEQLKNKPKQLPTLELLDVDVFQVNNS